MAQPEQLTFQDLAAFDGSLEDRYGHARRLARFAGLDTHAYTLRALDTAHRMLREHIERLGGAAHVRRAADVPCESCAALTRNVQNCSELHGYVLYVEQRITGGGK